WGKVLKLQHLPRTAKARRKRRFAKDLLVSAQLGTGARAGACKKSFANLRLLRVFAVRGKRCTLRAEPSACADGARPTRAHARASSSRGDACVNAVRPQRPRANAGDAGRARAGVHARGPRACADDHAWHARA